MTKPTYSNRHLKWILGIDTSSPDTVIAVNDTVVSWRSDRNQTNELLPKIDKLLAKLKLTPIQLDGVVVNVGPGSFTGLRVGVTVANGFGYGLGLPVVGMDQFAIVRTFFPKADVVLIDAGRGEVFLQRATKEPVMIKIAELDKQVKAGEAVALDFEMVPAVHEQLSRAGTIYLVNQTKKERALAMMSHAKFPRKFAQVLPLYVRSANITRPKPVR